MTTEKRYQEVRSMIEQIKDISLIDILNYFGVKYSKGLWECPNPLHNDNTPSCRYYQNSNLLHCFGCNQTWDSIKLWGELNHQDTTFEFFDICEDLIKFANISIDQTYEVIKKKQIEKNNDEDDKQESVNRWMSYSKSIDELEKNIEDLKDIDYKEYNKRKLNIHKIHLFFKKRCLNFDKIKKICDKNNISICHNYFNDITSILINDNNKVLYQRQIQDYIEDDNTKPNKKFIHGNSNITYLNDGSDVLVICEGIYDSFSILTMYNKPIDVISLNSVDNESKVIMYDKLKYDLSKYRVIYICTDNDIPGTEASKYLIDNIYLINENVKKWNVKGYENYKDINEYLISNN